MDDVGASTKQFEVYSKKFIGNFFFLKYFYPFKAWGPYKELSQWEWEEITKILSKTNSKMTVAITACYVEKDGRLIPFPEKFPVEADIIKKAVKVGLIEVANHGLTHCIVGKHLPRLLLSNRKYHREFWDYLPREEIKNHLEKSQMILENYFKTRIETFVPPGNVYNEFTKNYAAKIGLKYLSSKDNSDVFAFHDRDVVLNGVKWLREKVQEFKNKGSEIVTLEELHQSI